MRWTQLTGWCLLATAGGALAARRALFVVRIDGTSMEPTFHSGDAVLAVRAGFGPAVRRGDIVVCRLPRELQGPSGLLVKRAAGLAGDRVDGGDAVPAGRVFVRGDGDRSYDSRAFGPLPLASVRGRVIARLSLPVRRPSAIEG